MLNWLNRQKSPAAAAAAGYPQPPLANWRNREQSGDNRSRTLEPAPVAPVAPVKRRLRSLELFSLAVVIALIVGVDLYIFGINKRLSALESQFVEVKDWAFPASLLEGKYASLNARVRALTDAYSGLNEKLATVASQQQAVNVAARTPGDEAGPVMEAESVAASGKTGDATLELTDADLTSEAPAAGIARPSAGNMPAALNTSGLVRRAEQDAPAKPPVSDAAAQATEASPRPDEDAERMLQAAEEQPVLASSEEPASVVKPAPAADTQPSQASRKAGPWVINLLSDPNQSLATRFADKARDRGVTVEQNRTEVKGRVYWRVQITGFETASEAQARAAEVKEKLHLKDVWVFRQAG